METAEEIEDLFLGDAEVLSSNFYNLYVLFSIQNFPFFWVIWWISKVWRRPSHGHADPLGGNFPLVTSEGHHVLDVIFTTPILDLGIIHIIFFFIFLFLLVVSICLNRFLKRNCRFTRYTAQVAKTLDEVDGVVDHGVISGIAWVLFALQHDSFFLSLCFVSDILKEKKKDEQSSQLLNLLNIILQMHSHYCFEGWSSSSSW